MIKKKRSRPTPHSPLLVSATSQKKERKRVHLREKERRGEKEERKKEEEEKEEDQEELGNFKSFLASFGHF